MLIKFNFKNFKSFKNENCLDMEAASIKEHEYNTINIKDKKYLKVAAIYGANASGKTNVLEAFEFMKEKLMISDDTNMNSSELDNYYNFSFDEKTRNEPIALEVTFLAENQKIYQYGFEIKNKVIISEWLYVKKVNKSTPIFDRDENKVKFNKSYKAKINKFDVDSNSLFLSLYRKIEKDNEDFKSVYDWFLNSYYLDLGNPKFENRINHLISSKIINDKEYKLINQPNLVPCSQKCDLCQRACKTGALSAPYTMNPLRCVSFLTTFGNCVTPEGLLDEMYEQWVCGCDNCQDACPHNKRHDWHVGKQIPELEEIADAILPDCYDELTDDFLIRKVIPKTANHLKEKDVEALRKNAMRSLNNKVNRSD